MAFNLNEDQALVALLVVSVIFFVTGVLYLSRPRRYSRLGYRYWQRKESRIVEALVVVPMSLMPLCISLLGIYSTNDELFIKWTIAIFIGTVIFGGVWCLIFWRRRVPRTDQIDHQESSKRPNWFAGFSAMTVAIVGLVIYRQFQILNYYQEEQPYSIDWRIVYLALAIPFVIAGRLWRQSIKSIVKPFQLVPVSLRLLGVAFVLLIPTVYGVSKALHWYHWRATVVTGDRVGALNFEDINGDHLLDIVSTYIPRVEIQKQPRLFQQVSSPKKESEVMKFYDSKLHKLRNSIHIDFDFDINRDGIVDVLRVEHSTTYSKCVRTQNPQQATTVLDPPAPSAEPGMTLKCDEKHKQRVTTWTWRTLSDRGAYGSWRDVVVRDMNGNDINDLGNINGLNGERLSTFFMYDRWFVKPQGVLKQKDDDARVFVFAQVKNQQRSIDTKRTLEFKITDGPTLTLQKVIRGRLIGRNDFNDDGVLDLLMQLKRNERKESSTESSSDENYGPPLDWGGNEVSIVDGRSGKYVDTEFGVETFSSVERLDLGGDGTVDFVGITSDGRVQIRYYIGEFAWSHPKTVFHFDVDNAKEFLLRSVDVNADNRIDLAVEIVYRDRIFDNTRKKPRIARTYILRQTKNGNLNSLWGPYRFERSGTFGGLKDIDGDGHVDMMFSGGHAYIAWGDGKGNFGPDKR